MDTIIETLIELERELIIDYGHLLKEATNEELLKAKYLINMLDNLIEGALVNQSLDLLGRNIEAQN